MHFGLKMGYGYYGVMVTMQYGLNTDLVTNPSLDENMLSAVAMRGRFIFKLTQLKCFVALNKALFYIEKFISSRSKVSCCRDVC